MNINEVFPSNYLRAMDIKGKHYTLEIAEIKMEQMADESQKPVMFFHGAQKGIVLNKTNSMALAEHFTEETNNWIGKQVQVYTTRVNMQGKMVDSIVVEPYIGGSVIPDQPAQGPMPTNPPASDATAAASDGFDDDIPF